MVVVSLATMWWAWVEDLVAEDMDKNMALGGQVVSECMWPLHSILHFAFHSWNSPPQTFRTEPDCALCQKLDIISSYSTIPV